MASLTYDGINFATTLGGLPRISREINIEVEQGKVVRENHRITCTWHAVPSAGTLAQQQAAITAFEAAIEALENGGALIFADNAAAVCWAYDSSASANNHEVPLGVQIERISFPWGPAKHITNDPVEIVFLAIVQPCANDPITGVGSLIYQTTEEWDTGGLVTVSFSGQVCACDGYDVDAIFESLVTSFFTTEARDLFTAGGAVLSLAFGPTRLTRTHIDQADHCLAFSIQYGGGAQPQGLEARTLDLDVSVSLIQNLITIEIAATYGYRGGYIGAGSAGLSGVFGLGTSGTFSPIFGSASGPFGLGGAGGVGTFRAVWNEAWRFAGVTPSEFLLPGGRPIFLTTEPVMTVNTEAQTITSRKKFYAPWIWDTEMVMLDCEVLIKDAEIGTSVSRLMYPDVGSPDLFCYVQEACLDDYQISFTWTIVSRVTYYDMPYILTADRVNLWRVGTTRSYPSKLPHQISRSALPSEGYVTSRITQNYIARDPSQIPALKSIPIGSIRKIGSTGFIAPVASGSGVVGVV